MKKITLLAAFFAATVGVTAQTTIYEETFESYDDFIIEDIGDLTLVDNDGQPTYGFNGVTYENSGYTGSIIVFNSLETTPPLEAGADSNWNPNTGDRCAAFFAAVPGGGFTGNEDFMITPQIQLGTGSNVLTFFAKASDATFSQEILSVGVSTTDTDPSSFTYEIVDSTPTPLVYQEYTVNLDDYSGENVFIAFRCTSQDQFGLLIDDITVSGILSAEDQSFEGFNYFVNANQELNLSATTAMENIEIVNFAGQRVLTSELSNTNEVVNVSNLSTGVYIASVSIDGAQKSFKIAIK